MKRQLFNVGILAVMLGASGFITGCHNKPHEKSTGSTVETKTRIVESVDVTPGKVISPQDQAKVSSLAVKILGHVSKAKEDIQAKNVDAAKKDLVQASTLLEILKEVLPTVKVTDRILDVKTKLSSLTTTEVQQDLVPISSSIDQLYDVLSEGKAKEHVKKAKNVLAKEKSKGVSKAKDEFALVEEDFREVDMSVSYTSKLVKVAQADLDKGNTKEATDALTSVADGVLVFQTDMIDPVDVAIQRIWLATQDYAAKDHKTLKSRLEQAKKALEQVVQRSDQAMQTSAKNLIHKIEAIDLTKSLDNAGTGLEELWQDARRLVDRPRIKGKA